MHRRPVIASCAGVLAAVTLAACSTTTSGTPIGRAPHPTQNATKHIPTTKPVAHTVTLEPTVLAATDIGHGFAATEADGSIDALPCTPDVDPAKSAALDAAETEFVDAARSAQIDEQVMRFHSRSDAGAAYQAVQGGYGCPRAGTVDILGPTDIRSELGANGIDQAQAWQLSFGKNAGVVIVAQLNDRLVSLHFLARVGSTQTVVPQQVAQTAIAKVINGG